MRLKPASYFALSLIVALFMTSCLGENEYTVSEVTKITSFYLKNDSIEGISTCKFTIDNDSNVIYNADSLPYLTKVDSLIPVMSGGSLSSIYIYGKDTVLYTGSDTIDFSQPIKLRSYAQDEVSYRDYTVKVNVHKVDPDLYVWQGWNSEVYTGAVVDEKSFFFNEKVYYYIDRGTQVDLLTSGNAQTWSSASIVNYPSGVSLSDIVCIDSLLVAAKGNTLYKSNDGLNWQTVAMQGVAVEKVLFGMNEVLYALAKDGNGYFTAVATNGSWERKSNLPEMFPVAGAAVWVDLSETGKYRAFVLGGTSSNGTYLSSVWSTENGSYWANLGAEKEWFTPRAGASIIQYDGGLMLFGGRSASGPVADAHLFSPDYGLTWETPGDKMLINSLFVPRYNQSVVVTDKHKIYVIGGKTSTTFLKDVWYGVKNEMLFY